MEGPLLTKREQNLDDDSSSNEDHILDIITSGDPSSADEQALHDVVQLCRRFALFWAKWRVIITCNPVWILVEFVLALLQIVAAIVVLTLTKDEIDPQKLLRTLIISYTGGCIAVLPIQGLRFWHYYGSGSSETSVYEVVVNLKKMFDYFFVVWVVVLSWHLINNSSSHDNTTQQFWLCVTFLAISCILHVLPHLSFATTCFIYPLILRIIQSIDIVDMITDKIRESNSITIACIGIFAYIFCSCCCCRNR
ncbi:hypothetical protein ISN44_As01g016010 [Arabidopsis suecica]|uniref:Transmembrane protein n=1 Tax=Arabidopsis suecica TaxID=45249 RepID=A0A8T2H2N2_ARASU|nr:hypothetical protein ISN44_As01g016010 [Arabidopsis suecica]